jgi:hypothetical protein
MCERRLIAKGKAFIFNRKQGSVPLAMKSTTY